MFFYKVSRIAVKMWLLAYLGPTRVTGKQNLPLGPFVLVANHRYLWDAPLLAVSVSNVFFFMAKKELFNIPGLNVLLGHLNAFPVDRKAAAFKSIKQPIERLKTKPYPLIIFPTGSRFSNEFKPGYLLIAQKSSVPVVPAYISHKGWGRTEISFGEPYYINETVTHKTEPELNQVLRQEMAKLRA
ncbi:lysophospholipid acyltransferase family protein [Lentilactobacillus sp. Marseille-Q4993]|uniref:lysophospholipid acyltransferase family protein n=1 Tax=Lentilactobacillus sp. Marseille-Q4993 TaxID=3039492 RepID=UPI0024BD3332|nr:lysophospholipid acyltransferase family protein [Lentilactobacillus sp. Marseille-Q4993]